MSETLQRIRSLVLEYPEAGSVLERSAGDLADIGAPRFRTAYARTARLLGSRASELVVTAPSELSAVRPHWTLLDWTRLTLLLTALERTQAGQRAPLLLTLLERGEVGEQVSMLRTLPLLPDVSNYVEIGVAACRINARQVFEAIACENPFPAAHFPERYFNQMVLKAIFIEVAVSRVEGLSSRITSELCRMIRDYASERTAAARRVPVDVELVLSFEHAVRTESEHRETACSSSILTST